MAKTTKKQRKQQAQARADNHSKQNVSRGSSPWLYVAPALLLALVVFIQTTGYDFVNWDDDVNILENRGVVTFNLKQIWTETVIGNYNPLPITTFAIEHKLVGLNAGLYHFNNLLLHLINVVLVFFLGRRLKLNLAAAGLFACLFAIHPLRVESVAWVTERKDVLFTCFYFGALLLYEKQRQAGKTSSWNWAVAGLFALALVSKIQAVSLPLSMICFDYLRDREISLKEVLAKAPYFLMSLAVGVAGIYFLGENGSLNDATNYTFIDRLAVGAYAYTVYLIKSIFPYEMSPLYPYPSQLPAQAYASFLVLAASAALVVVGYLKKWVPLVFGLSLFTVNVIFMLQVLGAGQGYLADRFTYVGYIGLFWLFAYVFQHYRTVRPSTSASIGVGAAVYVLLLSFVSFKQTKIWQNGDTLWAHVSELYPKAATAYGNRAQYLREHGQPEQAMVLFGKAIDADPRQGSFLNSRGKMLFDQGKTQEALADYTRGIEIEPTLGELYINRGAAYAKLGRYDVALTDIQKGLELEPDNFNGYLNRSLLYYTTGKYREAVADYDILLEMRPERHDLLQERGSIRAMYGERNEAIRDLQQAIRMSDDKEKTALYQELLQEIKAGQ